MYKPGHSISYKNAIAASDDSDQPARPRRLISILAGRLFGSLTSHKVSFEESDPSALGAHSIL